MVSSPRIIYKSPPAPVDMAEYWHDISNLEHFWIQRRFNTLRLMAGSLIENSHSIAEIGCGSGLVQRQIEDHYHLPVRGFALSENALQKHIARLRDLCSYDIHAALP